MRTRSPAGFGLLATLMGTAVPVSAHATEIGSGRNFGLGIVLGDPTGLSAKLYVRGPANAVDFALATRTVDHDPGDNVYLHATYLWHPDELAAVGAFDLWWHVGIGGFVLSHNDGNDDLGIGARAPIGLDMNFNDVPLQVFGDIALIVPLLPGIDVGLDFGIGVRYYF